MMVTVRSFEQRGLFDGLSNVQTMNTIVEETSQTETDTVE